MDIRKFNLLPLKLMLSYSFLFLSDTPINALKFLDVVNMKDTQQKSQFYKTTLIEAMPMIPRVSATVPWPILSTGNGCSHVGRTFLAQQTGSTLIINGVKLSALRPNNLWITSRFMSVAKMLRLSFVFCWVRNGRSLSVFPFLFFFAVHCHCLMPFNDALALAIEMT